MKKREKLIYTFFYYHIPELIASGILLWFIHSTLFSIFCNLIRLTDQHTMYRISYYIFNFGLLILWILSVSIFIRNKIYYYFTATHTESNRPIYLSKIGKLQTVSFSANIKIGLESIIY